MQSFPTPNAEDYDCDNDWQGPTAGYEAVAPAPLTPSHESPSTSPCSSPASESHHAALARAPAPGPTGPVQGAARTAVMGNIRIDTGNIRIDTGNTARTTTAMSSSAAFAARAAGVGDNVKNRTRNHLRDFDAEFQSCVAAIDDEALDFYSQVPCDGEGKETQFQRLAQVGRDFAFAARQYGRIIIAEKFLPTELKTIPPCTHSLGGVAGGEKFIVHGILFKFAIDSSGLYGGSDDFAAKAAGHEYKGLMSCYNTHVQGLHYPLFAMIDYLGFRITAQSLLPISQQTLAYGSADGGRTVHGGERCPELARRMEAVGAALHLKPHYIRGKLVWTPCDLEGHVVTLPAPPSPLPPPCSMSQQTERYYVADFGRLFPPEPPSASKSRPRGANVVRLLRKELLARAPTGGPLSPDAFSRFGASDAGQNQHGAEVTAAFEALLRQGVPAFAAWLAQQRCDVFFLAGGDLRRRGSGDGSLSTARDRKLPSGLPRSPSTRRNSMPASLNGKHTSLGGAGTLRSRLRRSSASSSRAAQQPSPPASPPPQSDPNAPLQISTPQASALSDAKVKTDLDDSLTPPRLVGPPSDPPSPAGSPESTPARRPSLSAVPDATVPSESLEPSPSTSPCASPLSSVSSSRHGSPSAEPTGASSARRPSLRLDNHETETDMLHNPDGSWEGDPLGSPRASSPSDSSTASADGGSPSQPMMASRRVWAVEDSESESDLDRDEGAIDCSPRELGDVLAGAASTLQSPTAERTSSIPTGRRTRSASLEPAMSLNRAPESLQGGINGAHGLLERQRRPHDAEWMVQRLHRQGINCRFLLAVQSSASLRGPHERAWRRALLAEAVARSIRRLLRKTLRQAMQEAPVPASESLQHAATDLLNLVFGNSEESSQWWKGPLMRQMKESFLDYAFEDYDDQGVQPLASTPGSTTPGVPLSSDGGTPSRRRSGSGARTPSRSRYGLSGAKLRFQLHSAFAALAQRVFVLSSIEPRPHLQRELTEAPKFLFKRIEPFTEIDFELGSRTRRTAVVCYAEGTRLLMRARSRRLQGRTRFEERRRLCELAAAQFEEGLAGTAGGQEDPMVCCNYAAVLEFVGRRRGAQRMLRRAVRANPRHAHSLLCAAESLSRSAIEAQARAACARATQLQMESAAARAVIAAGEAGLGWEQRAGREADAQSKKATARAARYRATRRLQTAETDADNAAGLFHRAYRATKRGQTDIVRQVGACRMLAALIHRVAASRWRAAACAMTVQHAARLLQSFVDKTPFRNAAEDSRGPLEFGLLDMTAHDDATTPSASDALDTPETNRHRKRRSKLRIKMFVTDPALLFEHAATLFERALVHVREALPSSVAPGKEPLVYERRRRTGEDEYKTLMAYAALIHEWARLVLQELKRDEKGENLTHSRDAGQREENEESDEGDEENRAISADDVFVQAGDNTSEAAAQQLEAANNDTRLEDDDDAGIRLEVSCAGVPTNLGAECVRRDSLLSARQLADVMRRRGLLNRLSLALIDHATLLYERALALPHASVNHGTASSASPPPSPAMQPSSPLPSSPGGVLTGRQRSSSEPGGPPLLDIPPVSPHTPPSTPPQGIGSSTLYDDLVLARRGGRPPHTPRTHRTPRRRSLRSHEMADVEPRCSALVGLAAVLRTRNAIGASSAVEQGKTGASTSGVGAPTVEERANDLEEEARLLRALTTDEAQRRRESFRATLQGELRQATLKKDVMAKLNQLSTRTRAHATTTAKTNADPATSTGAAAATMVAANTTSGAPPSVADVPSVSFGPMSIDDREVVQRVASSMGLEVHTLPVRPARQPPAPPRHDAMGDSLAAIADTVAAEATTRGTMISLLDQMHDMGTRGRSASAPEQPLLTRQPSRDRRSVRELYKQVVVTQNTSTEKQREDTS